jgi:hypothetical protein
MVDLTPPQGVRAAAKRGIELVAAGKAGDGFMPATLQRARKIAAGRELTPSHVRRMHSFFSRHSVDRKADWGKAGEETPGYVAWMAWGGDAGASWSAKVSDQLDRARESAVEPVVEVLALGDRAFEVRIPSGEVAPLADLLEEITEREWELEHVGEAYDPELVDLIARTRAVAQSLADELAAEHEPTDQLDQMIAQLTAMARTHMADRASADRELELAMATYEDDAGVASPNVSEDVASTDPADLEQVQLMNDEMDADELSGLWNDRQLALHEALEQVYEEFGEFNKGSGPDGLHYMGADANPFKDQGLKCANCIFYEGGGLCEMLDEQDPVEDEAVCKMWIIPGSLIKPSEG